MGKEPGKIRGKLLDFKRRLSDRHMYSVVILVIAVVGLWGVIQYRQASQYKQKLENQYNRAFYELVGYVGNVESSLLKSMVTTSTEKTASILQDTWRQANMAQTNLGMIPVRQDLLSNTSKFLTQVGDLAYAYNNQNIAGRKLTTEEFDQLKTMHDYSVSLMDQLRDLQDTINAGRLKWNELAKEGTKVFENASAEGEQPSFENVDKLFQDVPKLIYDGPYADNVVAMEPRGIIGDDIDENTAKQKVEALFGNSKIKEITSQGPPEPGGLQNYTFKVVFSGDKDDMSATVSLTKKGGHFSWMLYNKAIESSNIDLTQAKESGRRFLESIGMTGMVDTYTLDENNVALINYAYRQDNVTIYPDLAKVKVSLADGEIVGFECAGYLFSHMERAPAAPAITPEEARAALNPQMTVESSGLAVIPTRFKTEVLCYEFKGKFLDNDVLVYINAQTGAEQDILLIVNTPNGQLTI